MNQIGRKIESLMKTYDKSYGDISEGTDIPKSAIHRYVTGETEKIPINRVVDIAKYFHVSPEYLLDWNSNRDYIKEFHEKGYKYDESLITEGYNLDDIAELVLGKENENHLYANNYVNDDEMNHIKKYRTLDNYGKKQVDNVLQNEYDRVKEQSMEIAEETTPYLFTKTEYLTGLSAGTGLFVFDDVPTQTTEVPEKYKDADFVIGVSGDSMEPTYYDGDKVAVKKLPSVNIGEIGVFMINGDGYIKELGNNVLISHNKKYKDIIIDKDTLCIGKVLGKL